METKKESTEVAKQQFIGPRRVIGVSVEESLLTNGGAEIVKVLYDGGHSEVMPAKSFAILVTNEPTDWTQLSQRRIADLTRKVLMVLAEHDLKAGEIANLTASVGNELHNSFNRATNYLWTKDDGLFTPGYNVVLDRSLLEADIIIKSIPQADAKKPEATEGGESAE